MTNPSDVAMEAERLLECTYMGRCTSSCCSRHSTEKVASALATRDARRAQLEKALDISNKAMSRALAVFKAQGESVRRGAVTGALSDAIETCSIALAKIGEKA